VNSPRQATTAMPPFDIKPRHRRKRFEKAP
jgi:hypothetical protein